MSWSTSIDTKRLLSRNQVKAQVVVIIWYIQYVCTECLTDSHAKINQTWPCLLGLYRLMETNQIYQIFIFYICSKC